MPPHVRHRRARRRSNPPRRQLQGSASLSRRRPQTKTTGNSSPSRNSARGSPYNELGERKNSQPPTHTIRSPTTLGAALASACTTKHTVRRFERRLSSAAGLNNIGAVNSAQRAGETHLVQTDFRNRRLGEADMLGRRPLGRDRVAAQDRLPNRHE